MYLHEHLEKLRYFYEVARLGSMKRASEAVFITQPSLSKSIKVLEEVTANDLFIRLPRGVKLTQEGEILFQYCHELFAGLRDLEKRLDNSTDPMAGSLRVGTYDSIGIYFWPKFLREFLPLYPNLSLEISTGRSRAMQEKLELGELDLILVVNPNQTQNIEVDVARKDVFHFYESTRKKTVYKTIEKAPLILMPDSFGSGAALKDKLNSMELGERQVYTTSSLESVKELTANGIGIGFLPSLVADDLVAKGALSKLSLPQAPKRGLFEHTIGLAFQKSRANNPLVKTVVEAIKKQL
jgi:DNA-binding transcriptional LysR family regulator